MLEIDTVSIRGKTGLGIKVKLFKAPLLVIAGKRGFLGCGYIDISTADKLEDAAAVVRGVDTFQDMLKAEVTDVSSKAHELGIRAGMRGEDVLEILL